MSVDVARRDQITILTSKKSTQSYDWSPEQVGTLLGSYYWGYCLSMFPGSIIAQKYGSYRVILLSCLVNAFVSLVFPVMISFGGFPLAVFGRVLLGASSGPFMPAVQGKTFESIKLNIN